MSDYEKLIEHLMDIKEKQAMTLERVDSVKQNQEKLQAKLEEHIEGDTAKFQLIEKDQVDMKGKLSLSAKLNTALTVLGTAISGLAYWLLKG